MRWIAKKTGPATSDVTAVDAAEKLSEKPGATVLAYLSELSGADFESYTECEQGREGIHSRVQLSRAGALSSAGLPQGGGPAMEGQLPKGLWRHRHFHPSQRHELIVRRHLRLRFPPLMRPSVPVCSGRFQG